MQPLDQLVETLPVLQGKLMMRKSYVSGPNALYIIEWSILFCYILDEWISA